MPTHTENNDCKVFREELRNRHLSSMRALVVRGWPWQLCLQEHREETPESNS